MNDRNKIIKKVSILGIIINLFLLVIKFTAGVISNSNALIADSLHSAEDMSSSVLSCFGASISSKKPNNKYLFGYGKAEYIFSFLISLFMIVTSISLLVNSINCIVKKEFISFSYISIIVCIVTIVIKICLYIYTNYQYKKTYSILIKASREDHRNDIYITTAAMIGVICSYFGITFVDSVLSVIISIWIGIVGVKIFISSFEVLMDRSISKDEELKIKREVLEYEEVICLDKIITKPIGSKYILILILSINNCNNLDFCYEAVERIKMKLKYKFQNIAYVFVEEKENKCIDK